MMKTRAILLALAVLAWPVSVFGQPVSDAECRVPEGTIPSVSLFSPNGGQRLDPGTVYDIVWSASGTDTVRISLSLDGGETFPLSVADSAGGFMHAWTVDDYATDRARIRIEAIDSCGAVAAAAVSAGDFSIRGQGRLLPAIRETEVSVSTPVSGSGVSGMVLIQAKTEIGASSVEFKITDSSGNASWEGDAVGSDDNRSWTGFWDSAGSENGNYELTVRARDADGRLVGEAGPLEFSVSNLTLPSINTGVLDPSHGETVRGTIILNALTDLEAEALDFVIRPDFSAVSAEPAVVYGLTGESRFLWTASFDTRRYPNGRYLVRAKAYVSGTVVGEGREVEVTFDNPEARKIAVSVSSPSPGAAVEGEVALVARTLTAGEAVDFVITEDTSAGGEAEPIVVRATPDLEKKKWTALWKSYGMANGSYGLKAKSYRDGILAGESAMQAVRVANSLSLVGVGLVSPVPGQTVNGPVGLEAEVGEAVERVDFLIWAGDAPAGSGPTVLPAEAVPGNLRWLSVWDTSAELDGRYRIQVRAWHGDRSVGESPKAEMHVRNGLTGGFSSGGLSLAERLAPETDPNREGEYDRESAMGSTPTVNVSLGLIDPSGREYLLPPGSLFKAEGSPAVYYYGRDGRRYGFPDSRTFFTWYGNFDNVRTVGASVVAAIPLGGSVTYRPGTRLVKITSDPKVYAVARGGVLRWVRSEVVARRL
ncbi:hypothetical protein JW899_00420, partial [Candidatus Uhrbacteria bacterium]|nr:hypothetical protein [Candidatus Uhrbacteria bacterium]